MSVPPYPIEGVVSWNMNTTCNYRCSYCTQRFLDDRAAWARDLPRFIDAFLALPGDWEIKLSGGEPFRHPDFLQLVQALCEGGRRVSVVTNFSAELPELLEFARLTSGRPGVISASLHLEYTSAEAFLERARLVALAHRGSLCVTCVATRDNLPRLRELEASYRAAGLSFKVQPEKQDREVIDYSAHEREQLIQLGGHNGTGKIEPCFEGRACWAGARYFIVDHKGEAFRCYPARRYRKQRLGNLLDGSFRLFDGAAACEYRYCNCTVPQQRGMVDVTEGRQPTDGAQSVATGDTSSC
ncbi:MAG TPA: radical SAM protein [Polyangiaceae bacterium]|nr:radical SAM protein [Polyangiaceae bacterium]